MHLYHRRRNVAAQMAEELKTVTYVTPPMEESRKKRRKKLCGCVLLANASVCLCAHTLCMCVCCMCVCAQLNAQTG